MKYNERLGTRIVAHKLVHIGVGKIVRVWHKIPSIRSLVVRIQVVRGEGSTSVGRAGACCRWKYIEYPNLKFSDVSLSVNTECDMVRILLIPLTVVVSGWGDSLGP